MDVRIFLLILNAFYKQGVSATCTLPEQFQNTVWIDSDKDELTFSTVSMTGWDFQTENGDTYQDWECFHKSNDGTKLYLIMLQTQNITILSTTYTAYLCMELTEISSQSYSYYLLWAEEEKYRYERISTTFSSYAITDPVQQLCFSTNNAAQAAEYPETGEYHILVKQGSEVAAKQECPSTFFGEYSYTVRDIDANTDYCGSGNEVWDVCSDYEKMTFNYTICNTQISYSENGSVFCVYSITSGSNIYHTLYNEDNTVNPASGTHRFTCMVSSIASDGSLSVSQTPGSCKKGQTPTDQPVQPYDGSVNGLNLQLSPRRLCPKTEDSKSGLSTGAIVGIVLGVLVLISIIILIVLLCIRKKGKRNKAKQETTGGKPVESPRSKKLSVDIDDIPHQRSPLWVHGPHGVAPIETKFSGDQRISKSPDLYNDYDPFSVFPLEKGKKNKKENAQSGNAQTLFQLDGRGDTKENSLNKESSMVIETNVSDSQKLKKKTINNSNSERISIEDLEINKVIPTRPESNSTETVLKPQKSEKESITFHSERKDDTSRNSNVTPKAVVLQTEDNTSVVSRGQYSISLSPNGICDGTTNDTRLSRGEIDVNDSEVAVLSQRAYRQQVFGSSIANQVRESSMTPILVTDSKQEHRTPGKLIENASKNSTTPGLNKSIRKSPKIVKRSFQKEDIHLSKIQNTGQKKEMIMKKKKKKNKIIVSSQNLKMSAKTKSQQVSKPKIRPNKRGHQALNDLLKSRFHTVYKNKKGTFYNEDIPTVTEAESYLNISEMNNSGICYDDDNEKARALGYWNDDSFAANETAIFEENRIKTPNDMRLALGATYDRNESRLTADTVISPKGTVSARTISAITSRIDSRGAKYFIENESASIAIHVKADDVPEDFEVNYLTGSINAKDNEGDVEEVENADEDDFEDEDEDIEEYDDANEVRKDTIETTMSVLYGTTNDDDDEDPDKMVLTDYEHNLQSIKE